MTLVIAHRGACWELPENTLAHAKAWAAGLDCPAYAIDDETAIRVVGDAVDVVSEGQWHRFDV